MPYGFEVGDDVILEPRRNGEYRTPCCRHEVWDDELPGSSGFATLWGGLAKVVTDTNKIRCPYCNVTILKWDGMITIASRGEEMWPPYIAVPYTWLRHAPP